MNITEQLVADLREANAGENPGAATTFVPHCLIVEDDPHDAELSRIAVQSVDNVTADIAHTGDEAIEILQQAKHGFREPFHIVFLDLNLAGSAAQGYQVLQWIKRESPRLHVVIVSGYIDEGVLRLLSGESYIGIIKKPLHEQNLREILRKHRMDTDDYSV